MKYNKPNFEEGYDSDGEIGPHSFAFLVLEEGGVTNEARDQIAVEERHQV
jgi:hypothetical protein